MSTDQLQFNDLKDIKEAPILEYSLNIFPFFRKLFNSQFSYFIVIAL